MTHTFAFELDGWFIQHRDEVRGDLERYFSGTEGDQFTGRWFEPFAGMGDPASFGAADLLAVESLSVQVPPEAAAALLVTRPEDFNSKLREIPLDHTLWEVEPRAVATDSPADALHAELRTLPGVDWVTAGKLMAAKRPALIPVYDSKVRALLNPSGGPFWEPLREVLADERRRSTIEDVCSIAPDHVTLLRRIDVALWMA